MGQRVEPALLILVRKRNQLWGIFLSFSSYSFLNEFCNLCGTCSGTWGCAKCFLCQASRYHCISYFPTVLILQFYQSAQKYNFEVLKTSILKGLVRVRNQSPLGPIQPLEYNWLALTYLNERWESNLVLYAVSNLCYLVSKISNCFMDDYPK